MFGPERLARDAAELASVVAAARRAHALQHLALDREHKGRHARRFERARRQRQRLMTETRRRDQQHRLHLVAFDALDQLRHGVAHKARGVRDETVETPEDRVQLPDDAVAFKLEQARERYLRVHVARDRRRIVTAPRPTQVRRFNLDGDFAEARVAVR